MRMSKSEARLVADGLLACPFCGCKPTATIRGDSEVAVNPKAQCATEDCWGAKLPVICLDVPEQVNGWNTRQALRSFDMAGSQG
jgi:hypothetical protein